MNKEKAKEQFVLKCTTVRCSLCGANFVKLTVGLLEVEQHCQEFKSCRCTLEFHKQAHSKHLYNSFRCIIYESFHMYHTYVCVYILG